MNVSHTLPDQFFVENIKLNLLIGTSNIFITVFVLTIVSIVVVLDFEKLFHSIWYLFNVPDNKYCHISTACPVKG
jgi:hypothetical protein